MPASKAQGSRLRKNNPMKADNPRCIAIAIPTDGFNPFGM
jgi:hypothetical protein